MNEQYYCLRLDDPATPAFCSFDKPYFGTQNELMAAMDRMGKTGVYHDTVKGVREFFAGNHSVTHPVAYNTFPALIPVRRVCSSRLSIAAHTWEHLNVWRWPYLMGFEKAEIKQILIEHESKFYRCIRAWITDLCYGSVDGEKRPLTGGFWGHESLMAVKHTSEGHYEINNLLYVVEDTFDSLSDADNYILDPNEIVFDRICDEIFADG